LVPNPVQKYSVIHTDGKDYNYFLVETIFSGLESPFHA
jgi:hypothetical protein